MKLPRLGLLFALLALVSACGVSPTAPLSESGDALFGADKGVLVLPDSTASTTSSTDGDEDGGGFDDPGEGDGRGGGYVGSGS
jgi:hypothetical protein